MSKAAPPPAVEGQALSGRVVGSTPPSSSSKLRRSKRKAKGAAPSTARVPPSSPEQVEAARRGEYDYTGRE